MNNFKGRDFLSLMDYTSEDLMFYLKTAIKIKSDIDNNRSVLKDKNLAMIFQKPSLRTRMSFQVGMNQLGGHAQFISPDEISLGKREAVKDVARVLSRYVDGIMARVFSHDDIVELAKYSDKPVVNGLSDLLHPCQGMADYLTILERFGHLDGLRLCYVGDGNNVCNTLIVGASKFGLDMAVACPKGYEPNKDIIESASKAGANIKIVNDPIKGVKGSDIVYTDTWVSMGQEEEKIVRNEKFKKYQVNEDLTSHAKEGHIVMHCLPAHRNDEITDGVMDGPNSAIFDQAENRLHAQKAILALNL